VAIDVRPDVAKVLDHPVVERDLTCVTMQVEKLITDVSVHYGR